MIENKEPYKNLIIVLSVVLPLAVAALFGIKIPGYDFSFLPPVYATINGITALLLIIAVIAIKNKKKNLHETLMKTCIVLLSIISGHVCRLSHNQRINSLWWRRSNQICLFLYFDNTYCVIDSSGSICAFYLFKGTFG